MNNQDKNAQFPFGITIKSTIFAIKISNAKTTISITSCLIGSDDNMRTKP